MRIEEVEVFELGQKRSSETRVFLISWELG
jgi:hypothetical protein